MAWMIRRIVSFCGGCGGGGGGGVSEFQARVLAQNWAQRRRLIQKPNLDWVNSISFAHILKSIGLDGRLDEYTQRLLNS